MNWSDCKSYIEMHTPSAFDFTQCLVFLGRSEQELLHRINGDYLYKLLKFDEEFILCKIGYNENSIQVDFPLTSPSRSTREKIAAYLWAWFDLAQDLRQFYEMAQKDTILQPLAQKYYGLRLMGMPDLFEALVWAIIGQQINLTFAYTLKKRFVEQFGENLIFEGETYWLFPTYEKIATISVDTLRQLQFTVRKSEYIIGIAQLMASGALTKESLLQQDDYLHTKKSLMAIRGIGAWTADYVMMKSLHCPTAFPIADVGLHNALKIQQGLEQKPTLEEISQIATHWKGWQAYATFYLWRSLYE
ncbi:DNA-3-methyladenine glycosylase family protein [Lysinibacillus sp. UGB7]|uniref:DNA-3-methyladenine glycosylase family protein n=1 Tax=Lysinibacillus sp. UGB7 TaxID=3411039 RepID=UPI003B7756C6